MSTLTRRQLLGSAILAGAGATVVQNLTRFDPASAATDPDIDPNFLMGQVVQYDSSSGVFQVVDLDLQVRTAQLISTSQVWKQGLWNAVPLTLNDCIMSRGTLSPQNVLQIGQLWVDISNYRGQLTSVGAASVTLTPGAGSSAASGSTVTATVNSLTQVNVDEQTVTGTTQGLAPGQYVNLIGYGDPAAGTLVATLILGPAADLGSPAPVITGTGTDCTVTSYKHVASWFCCGNISSACGANCGGSGSGSCGDCRADRLHMAWPNLSTTSCNVTCDPNCTPPGTRFCCRTIGKLDCGDTVVVGNPCLLTNINVSVRTCGPCVHCISSTGCDNRTPVTFDLTPCAFTKIGGRLSAGVQDCDASACVS